MRLGRVRRRVSGAIGGSKRVQRALNATQHALTPVLVWALPRIWRGELIYRYFDYWEKRGLHITTNHFYSPIPDTAALPADFGQRQSELPGIEMNEQAQLRLLREISSVARDECRDFAHKPTADPHEFYFENGQFGGMDAPLLYCLVRHFRPKTILEVGSGHSTRIATRAAALNGDTTVVCIEPYPAESLRTMPGVSELLVSPVQAIDLARFSALEANDILFIDSSHVSRAASDVNYLYLEVLPRLRPGVIVHVHDIFLPQDYPRAWLTDHLLFWNEQYLLHAFLLFNSAFEVLFANSYMALRQPDALRASFPDAPWLGGGSFWMRRV